MIFAIDPISEKPQGIEAEDFAELDIMETNDLQEWIVEQPEIIGEDLLIIQTEYSDFEQTRDRLDLLALDRDGKLVVAELKRDKADETTDLQAIKYASYCATLTAQDIQKEYRKFWNDRNDNEDSLTPENVGEIFKSFLKTDDEEIHLTDEGWARFELDDKPRILLVAGSFGIQVTAPTVWLIEEYDLDVSCVTIQAYEHNGEILLNSRQIIPVKEVEEYMTKRREKQERQETGTRRTRSLYDLLDRGVLQEGDEVFFDPDRLSDNPQREWTKEDDFWWATVTGKTGQSDNIRWKHDGNEYSFTGLSKEILHRVEDRDKGKALHGYWFWCHPAFDGRYLADLRDSDAEASDRSDADKDQADETQTNEKSDAISDQSAP